MADSPLSSPREGLSSSSQLPTLHTDSLAESSGVGASLGNPPAVSEDDVSRSMRISLQLEARDLPNMDTRGKSDPFVVIYKKVDTSSSREEWIKIGQTETVYNNLSPKWSTLFSMEYRFGANFVLRFSIYDRDSKDDDLSRQDYIGEVSCTVAQIVLADNQRLILPVHRQKAKPGTKLGILIIRGEEEKGDLGDSVTLQFVVNNLRHGRKPFYVLSRKNRNDGDYSPVLYSEVHQRYNGSQWTEFKPITKSLSKMVNGDMDRELKIHFLDYDRRGRHYSGGCTTFTLRSIRSDIAASGPGGKQYILRKHKSNGQIAEAGFLRIKNFEISMPYSFLDYIRSGVIINLVVAVDMSATNGNPAYPSSLQYNNRQSPNEYVMALREVGNVLAAYDTSKTFPAFGFGAALPPHYNEVAHCFALTGNITQPVCDGVEGVIEMYYNALNNVGPWEPCLFGPVLEHVIRLTKDEDDRDDRTVYTVLLLVTDGDFQDFANVANLICSAAELPLSIVIVGVGNSRFVQLEKLDGDETPLCSTEGTPCARDIVQFVQFHKHRYNPAQLSREVLDEIPEQLVSYMCSKSIKPSDIKRHIESPVNPPIQNSPSGPYIPGTVSGMPTSSPMMTPSMQQMSQTPHPVQSGVQTGISNAMPPGVQRGMSNAMQSGVQTGMSSAMQSGIQTGMSNVQYPYSPQALGVSGPLPSHQHSMVSQYGVSQPLPLHQSCITSQYGASQPLSSHQSSMTSQFGGPQPPPSHQSSMVSQYGASQSLPSHQSNMESQYGGPQPPPSHQSNMASQYGASQPLPSHQSNMTSQYGGPQPPPSHQSSMASQYGGPQPPPSHQSSMASQYGGPQPPPSHQSSMASQYGGPQPPPSHQSSMASQYGGSQPSPTFQTSMSSQYGSQRPSPQQAGMAPQYPPVGHYPTPQSQLLLNSTMQYGHSTHLGQTSHYVPQGDMLQNSSFSQQVFHPNRPQ